MEMEMKTKVDSTGSPRRILLNGEVTPSPDEIVVSSSRCDEEVPLDVRWRRPEAMRMEEPCDASAGEKSLMVDMAADQSRRHSDSEETMSTATSPCESAVALDELLPDRSESLDEMECRIDDADYGTGLICCGVRLPTIDFQNARTQKVCMHALIGHCSALPSFFRLYAMFDWYDRYDVGNMLCCVSVVPVHCVARRYRTWNRGSRWDPRCLACSRATRHDQVVHLSLLLLLDIHCHNGCLCCCIR